MMEEEGIISSAALFYSHKCFMLLCWSFSSGRSTFSSMSGVRSRWDTSIAAPTICSSLPFSDIIYRYDINFFRELEL